MSASIPSIPPAPAPSPKAAQRDRIIASAQSLPDLISQAETFDPAMATKLKGQATIASATPIGALVGGVVGLIVTKYGLGWDAAMINTVSGLLILAGGYVAHWIQARATSIVPKN